MYMKRAKKCQKVPTDVHVRIFTRPYSDTSWEFTREIEEEKLEF